MANRVAPHSIEAERSVLGSILLDNACLKDVSSLIDSLDFYLEKHREIFRTLLSLHLQHNPFDLVTMVQCLKDGGKLNEIGGAEYLGELLDYTPTSANVKHYCRIVKEKSVARQLIDFSGKLGAKAANGNELEQTIIAANKRLAEITGGLDGLNGVSAADIIPFVKRQVLYAEYIKNIESSRFKIGFNLLDRQIRGLAPGELMIIIAYSGTFKTAFLQNLLLRGAEATGFFQLFFSLEMPVEKVFEREMQIQGGVSGWDVESHFSGKCESSGAVDGMNRTGSRGLLVCDKPRLTLEKIGRYVEIARQKFGRIGAIGIDYLGLIQAPGKTLFEKTAYVSIEAKNLAKELNLPIIMLCQINRVAATGSEIETHSAKGGGDIKAAADFMLGFQNEKKDQLTCKILKNRNAPAGGKFLVDIARTALQFKDMTTYTQESAKSKNDIPF